MEDRHRGGPVADRREVRLAVLGGFRLTVEDERIPLPHSVERVLVAVAVGQHEQDRTVLGAMLYPDGRRDQVLASLRSALWRARRAARHDLVESLGQRVRLADGVDVDLRHWTHRARSVASQPAADPAGDRAGLVEALTQELLPCWGEEWLILDRQRWDQLRLHALERLAEQYASTGRYVDALDAGLAAVAIEPYRETAHRALIGAYIAEGNCASALAQYRRYQRLLRRELGVRPTPQLEALVSRLTAHDSRRPPGRPP